MLNQAFTQFFVRGVLRAQEIHNEGRKSNGRRNTKYLVGTHGQVGLVGAIDVIAVYRLEIRTRL